MLANGRLDSTCRLKGWILQKLCITVCILSWIYELLFRTFQTTLFTPPVFIHSFIHSAVCLTPSAQPLSKPVLHTVRSTASSFDVQYLLFSIRSPSSCLRLLPHLPVFVILPSITCFRRQFLHKLRPIQLTFLLFFVYRTFLSPWLSEIHCSHDRSNWSSPSFSSNTFQNFPGISNLRTEVSKYQHHKQTTL
jgi:hypothetical protein